MEGKLREPIRADRTAFIYEKLRQQFPKLFGSLRDFIEVIRFLNKMVRCLTIFKWIVFALDAENYLTNICH